MWRAVMLTLIVTIVFGLIIGFFATQNTGLVSLTFFNYPIAGIPLYVVVVGALLTGLSLSWIVSLINGVSTGFTLRGKEKKIADYRKEIAELTKQIHQLELENTKLTAETNAPDDDKAL